MIDLRTIKPLDWQTVHKSLKKTGRMIVLDTGHKTGSVASDIISNIVTNQSIKLKLRPVKLAMPDFPEPTSFALTKNFYISSRDIVNSVLKNLNIRKKKTLDFQLGNTTTNLAIGLKVHFKDMIQKLSAAVLFKIKKNLKILELKIPKLKKGQVLVKVIYSGICKSQILEIIGGRNNSKWLPHLLGHEASGKVVETGYGVKKVKKGDEVILSWIKSDGMNSNAKLHI